MSTINTVLWVLVATQAINWFGVWLILNVLEKLEKKLDKHD